MPRYSKHFKHLRPSAISLTREFVRSKPWRSRDFEEQAAIAQAFVNDLSLIYHIDPPTVILAPLGGSLGGYNAQSNVIALELGRQLSATTIVHEFRHALQAQRNITRRPLEHDARGWSLSLMRKAAPRRFRKMVNLGRILFESPLGPRPPAGSEPVSLDVVLPPTYRAEDLDPNDPIQGAVRGMMEEHGVESLTFVDPGVEEDQRIIRDANDDEDELGHQPHPEASEAEETATRRAFGLPS